MNLAGIVRPPAGFGFGAEFREIRLQLAELRSNVAVRVRTVPDVSASAPVPAVLTPVLTTTITVPSGASAAMVCVDATYTASGSGTSLKLQVNIGGVDSPLTASSTTSPVRQLFWTLLDDLAPGDTYAVTLTASGAGSWTGAVGAHTATILYFR